MPSVVPVILSGGAGTRLWPLSRHSAPKQLQRLLGSETLLGSTIARVDNLDGRVVVVANVDTLDEVASEIPAGRPRLLIGEPIGRNTAAAVAAAALVATPDEVLLVLPADHHVVDVAEFRKALERAVVIAGEGRLVTFGVVPTRPETGFGYIVPAPSALDPALDARPIDRFVEKPEASTATDLIAAGALWNSGMFVFPVTLLLEEMARYAPEVLKHVEEAVRSAVSHGDTIALGREFESAPALPIDTAVMERTDRGAVISLGAGWNDVGSWESLWELGDHDDDGNVAVGDVVTLDASNSYLRSEGPLVAAIGVEGLVVVATEDAVLIVPRERAQEVKALFEMIRARPESQ
jgi:mannose-1-phosphate guanylyltransferase / mannose-6-phosphate isomerase